MVCLSGMSVYLPVAIGLCLILAGVVFVLLTRLKTLNQALRDLKSHPSDWASLHSQELIQEASKNADRITTQAEMDSLKLVTDKKMESALFDKHYQEKLDLLSTQLINSVNSNMQAIYQKMNDDISEIQSQYQNHVATLQNQMVGSQKNIEEGMRTKVNELLFKFEENLSSFLANSEQKSFESVNLELKAARQLIESYKAQQLSLVDENIVSVLERTLDLVLKEKLSLRNQVDLVYESLEKAKVEKFFS